MQNIGRYCMKQTNTLESLKELKTEERGLFLDTLKVRFENNKYRHPNTNWSEVEVALEKSLTTLQVLYNMEQTGGEPDVIEFTHTNKTTFVDCSKETPLGRRNLCYDLEALEKRKQYKPLSDALTEADKIGITLLTEEEYRQLQEKQDVDLRTSSWLLSPSSIRNLGGALFGDKRYKRTFIYHNGAESYYGVRGFRGKVEL